MQNLLSKYGLAAHLAVIAVAPLFLFPYLASSTLAIVWIWMTLFGLVWFVMEPSRIGAEVPHEARERAIRTLIVDPLFYFLVFALLYAAVVALNNGVRMSYNAEIQHWYLKEAAMPLFPASVKDAGFFPFAGSLALLVIVMGVRHGLGRSARLAFLAVATVVAGFAGLFFVAQAVTGSAVILKLTQASYVDPRFIGDAFGLLFMIGVVALAGAIESRWYVMELLLVLALLGNLLAVTLLAPLLDVAIALGGGILLLVLSVIFNGGRVQSGASLRLFVEVLAVIAVMVMFVMSASSLGGLHARYLDALRLQIFPEDYMRTRTVLSRIGFDVVKKAPWIGSGLGSFPLDIRFHVHPGEYRLIPPMQAASIQGWWQLVAERGVVGAILLAVTWSFLAVTWGYRLVMGWKGLSLRSLNLLFPVLTAAAVALMFFNSSILRPEVQLLFFVLLTVSASSAPRVHRAPKNPDKGN